MVRNLVTEVEEKQEKWWQKNSANCKNNMWISYKDKEVEPVEPVHMNIYQSNTYRKGSSWLHFDDEPKAQDLNGFKSGVNRHLLSLYYF